MDVYAHIRRSRRMIWAGIALLSTLAVAGAALRIANSDPLSLGEALGGVALAAAFGIAPLLAWRSLDRRPELLSAAVMTAVVTGFISIAVLPIAFIAAILWFRALESRPKGPGGPRRLVFPVLAIVAVLSLFAYTNPTCHEVRSDGSMTAVDPGTHGFSGDWSFSLGTTSESSSGSVDERGDHFDTICASDTIVPAEALASLALTGVAATLALRWAPRTSADRDTHDSASSNG